MRRFAAALVGASLLLSAAGHAQGRELHPHVIDNSHALFETTRDHLEAESADIARKTGVEVFVLVQPQIGDHSPREAALAAPIWNPEREQVLLLLAMSERQVRIEASPSITARIPDAEWARLIQTQMLPDLRRGRNGAAVRAGFDAIGQKLEGTSPALPSPVLAGDTRAFRDLVFVLIAGLLAASSFNGARHLKIRRGRW